MHSLLIVDWLDVGIHDHMSRYFRILIYSANHCLQLQEIGPVYDVSDCCVDVSFHWRSQTHVESMISACRNMLEVLVKDNFLRRCLLIISLLRYFHGDLFEDNLEPVYIFSSSHIIYIS